MQASFINMSGNFKCLYAFLVPLATSRMFIGLDKDTAPVFYYI